MSRRPANEGEHGVAVDVMRAALATLIVGRRQPVILTERQRRKAYGVVLRMLFDQAGTITLWTEAADGTMRPGVAYVTEPLPSEAVPEEPGS